MCFRANRAGFAAARLTFGGGQMTTRKGLFLRSLVGGLGCTILVAGAANAGPPFRTDDPEPVEYQHWEYYTFTTGTHVDGDTGGVAPAMEFNYGLIPNGQFHLVVPHGTFDSPTGGPSEYASAIPRSASSTAS